MDRKVATTVLSERACDRSECGYECGIHCPQFLGPLRDATLALGLIPGPRVVRAWQTIRRGAVASPTKWTYDLVLTMLRFSLTRITRLGFSLARVAACGYRGVFVHYRRQLLVDAGDFSNEPLLSILHGGYLLVKHFVVHGGA